MFESVADALCPVLMLLALIAIPITLRYLRPGWYDERASRRRRLAQVRTRRCLGCGYDVRASDFRCSECGRVIVSEAAVMGPVSPDAAALENVRDDEPGNSSPQDLNPPPRDRPSVPEAAQLSVLPIAAQLPLNASVGGRR